MARSRLSTQNLQGTRAYKQILAHNQKLIKPLFHKPTIICDQENLADEKVWSDAALNQNVFNNTNIQTKSPETW